MSHIGKNIRKIRTVKKLSQQAFAEVFGLSRANIGSYEEGRAEPKIAVVMDIAKKFGIEMDALMNKELKVNDISHFKSDAKFNLKPNNTTPDEENGTIPFVGRNNFNSYIHNAESPSFIKVLPQIRIPGFEYKASRGFEIGSNELVSKGEGVFENDVLICVRKNANNISNLVEGRIYAVLLKDRLIIRRLVFGLGTYEFYAENKFYGPIEIIPAEILEIWEAKVIISAKGGRLIDSIPLFSNRKGNLEGN